LRSNARQRLLAGLIGLVLLPVPTLGQDTDREGAAREGEAQAGPGPAPFEPSATADEELIEEIIVRGRRDEWRLPDMGDTLRREREELEKARPGQVDFEFLPLYDPEQASREPDLFRMYDPEQRVGKIELFRFRFGGD
jgi:hypothetical protein